MRNIWIAAFAVVYVGGTFAPIGVGAIQTWRHTVAFDSLYTQGKIVEARVSDDGRVGYNTGGLTNYVIMRRESELVVREAHTLMGRMGWLTTVSYRQPSSEETAVWHRHFSS